MKDLSLKTIVNRIKNAFGKKGEHYKRKHSHFAEYTDVHWMILFFMNIILLAAIIVLSYSLYARIYQEKLVPASTDNGVQREEVAWDLLDEILIEAEEKESLTLRVLSEDPSLHVPSL